jgi:hypothetical protein
MTAMLPSHTGEMDEGPARRTLVAGRPTWGQPSLESGREYPADRVRNVAGLRKCAQTERSIPPSSGITVPVR